jgi:hypothetical protein
VSGCWDAGADNYLLPCDIARLVAHIRSLEACAYCYPEFDELCTGCQARAALGEAQ